MDSIAVRFEEYGDEADDANELSLPSYTSKTHR